MDHVVPSGDTWDDKCIEFFSRLVLGKTVTVTVKVISCVTLYNVISDHMIQTHSSNPDPVMVDLTITLPGSSPQDIGQLLVANCSAEVVVPQTITYIPATPPSNGTVMVTFISDDGIICCQAANSSLLCFF